MNKVDLAKSLTNQTDLTKEEALHLIEMTFNAIKEALIEGNKVSLVGFGIFHTNIRNPRKGRNPKTNETIEVPSKKGIKFKPSSILKSKINDTNS